MFAWIRRLLNRKPKEIGREPPAVAESDRSDPSFPSWLTVCDSMYALDGGTILLQAFDEAGGEHRIVLAQHMSPDPGPSQDRIPGRLYFDDELVPIRSELESRLLRLFRAAEVRCEPTPDEVRRSQIERISRGEYLTAEAIQSELARQHREVVGGFRDAVLRFVASEEYVEFAARVDLAADPTRYDVWLAWDPSNRSRAIVKLGSVLGINVRAARALLDLGAPVASAVRAAEVSRLSIAFREPGLSVHVQPEFRWPLG